MTKLRRFRFWFGVMWAHRSGRGVTFSLIFAARQALLETAHDRQQNFWNDARFNAALADPR